MQLRRQGFDAFPEFPVEQVVSAIHRGSVSLESSAQESVFDRFFRILLRPQAFVPMAAHGGQVENPSGFQWA